MTKFNNPELNRIAESHPAADWRALEAIGEDIKAIERALKASPVGICSFDFDDDDCKFLWWDDRIYFVGNEYDRPFIEMPWTYRLKYHGYLVPFFDKGLKLSVNMDTE